ncbi:MAG TPA: MFS transporter [Thermoanaerobaculia bacterium]|nr:MFS transporter [Thermoanaerobaculia bacterium]
MSSFGTGSSAGSPAGTPAGAPAGYRELLFGNTAFRRLWAAEIVSLLGDWFNTIALYTLVDRLTGSPMALGAVFIVKLLPMGLASPVAGLIVDRWNRRRVMIASDLLRAVLVLGLLLVDEPGDVWLVYVVTALQMVVGSVFEPARAASLPNITSARELVTANALSAATWSAMLALGAALGGVATEWLGEQTVFVVDSATYLVSAWFLMRIAIPQETDPPEAGPTRLGPVLRRAGRNILDGWSYLRRNRPAGRVALAKSLWSLGGGGLVYMLVLLGERLEPAAQATAIGVLFAVRGLGTGVGPIVGRRLFVDARAWVAVMGWMVIVSGAAYCLLAALPWGWWVVLPVLVAHAGSGANWVFATVLLQRRAEDRFRGRAFATEWLLITAADAVSILAASTLLEAGWLTLRTGFLVFATVQVACGAAWLLAIVPQERSLAGDQGETTSTRP